MSNTKTRTATAWPRPWVLWLLMSFAVVACASESSTETLTTDAGSGADGGGGRGGGTGGTGQGPGASTGGGLGVGGFTPTPVRDLDGLESITFWERTGGAAPTEYTFLVDGTELTTRLDDPLATTNQDITGTPQEFYDVFYSDEDGTFNGDGSYLTISGVFPSPLPAGGGLNLAEIGLNFSNASVEYGNYVASFMVLGDNGNDTTVDRCIDGDLQSHTTMGNTNGATERLRLTLGFASTSGVPK